MWALVLALGWYLYQSISPNIDIPDSGYPAPDFSLTTLEGDTLQLSGLEGQVVVLNIWATWCPPCRVEIPGFKNLQEEFAGEVQFVGLSVDEEGFDVVGPFAREKEINYPQLASREVAARSYGETTTIPRTYLIDREGEIRYMHSGLLLEGSLRAGLEKLVSE